MNITNSEITDPIFKAKMINAFNNVNESTGIEFIKGIDFVGKNDYMITTSCIKELLSNAHPYKLSYIPLIKNDNNENLDLYCNYITNYLKKIYFNYKLNNDVIYYEYENKIIKSILNYFNQSMNDLLVLLVKSVFNDYDSIYTQFPDGSYNYCNPNDKDFLDVNFKLNFFDNIFINDNNELVIVKNELSNNYKYCQIKFSDIDIEQNLKFSNKRLLNSRKVFMSMKDNHIMKFLYNEILIENIEIIMQYCYNLFSKEEDRKSIKNFLNLKKSENPHILEIHNTFIKFKNDLNKKFIF